MNYFVTIDLLGLRKAQTCRLQQDGAEIDGIFVPLAQNDVEVKTGKDGKPHAVLAISAYEYNDVYKAKCEGKAPSHALEQRMSMTEEMELFGQIQARLQMEHTEWVGKSAVECEDLRKAIYTELRKMRTTVGKMYAK